MFSCTFNVENTKKLIDSQIQIPKVYEDDICIFLALKIDLQSFVSVLCAKLFCYYIWGSLGVANVGGMMCMCMCGVFVMCVMYIVFVCMCM